MTAADPRDGLRNDFLHGIVADEVASALLAIGIEAVPEGYLETIASEIVRRYMGGNALAHARPEAVDAAMVRRANAAYQAARQASFVATEHDCIRAALKAALTPDQSP